MGDASTPQGGSPHRGSPRAFAKVPSASSISSVLLNEGEQDAGDPDRPFGGLLHRIQVQCLLRTSARLRLCPGSCWWR